MGHKESNQTKTNTLAEWKKLESNEIIFSQGFTQKVSTSCFVFNSLPAMSADNICNDNDKYFYLRLRSKHRHKS